MNTLPPALWSVQWRGINISVFGIGENPALSLKAAVSVLNEEEKSRASRFHFAADRERWIRSRALLRMTLANCAGRNQREVQQADAICFHCGSHGKPFLSEPGTPLHFNLSHSGDFAAIASGPEPVGVDIEAWKDDLPVADLAAHEFLPDESAAIRCSPAPHLLFYQLWTAKEAVMKCTGLGLSLPPAAIQIRGESASGIRSAVRLDENVSFEVLTHENPGTWILSVARQESSSPSS